MIKIKKNIENNFYLYKNVFRKVRVVESFYESSVVKQKKITYKTGIQQEFWQDEWGEIT